MMGGLRTAIRLPDERHYKNQYAVANNKFVGFGCVWFIRTNVSKKHL